MDPRAAKLALARKKLKDHQEKKSVADVNNSLETNHGVPPLLDTVEVKENVTNIIEPSEVTPAQEHQQYQHKTIDQNIEPITPKVDVTEILISTKTNLEAEIYEQQSKIAQMEYNLKMAISSNNEYKQHNNYIENELKNVREKYLEATELLALKERTINEYNTMKASLTDENNNLQEQLEFTKNILCTKDMEISSLNNQLFYMQNQLDSAHLQLQQLTGSQANALQSSQHHSEHNVADLLQKISALEQQLKTLQKERGQITSHYEHYVRELNEQLKTVITKNEELSNEVQMLSNRENSLIQHLSDMEIRLQNYRDHQVLQQTPITKTSDTNEKSKEFEELQINYDMIQSKLKDLTSKYDELQRTYSETAFKLKELNEEKEAESQDETRNITKLNADITSDKIAAQRATEQNKKLKQDLQELEEAFVKISQDKLELTEKVAAEKFLNRELTIKLAEIEEKANETRVTLKAKDGEMMRLQTSYRDIEAKYEKLVNSQNVSETIVNENGDINSSSSENGCSGHSHSHSHEVETIEHHEHSHERKHQCMSHTNSGEDSLKIPKEDAMTKLQERFLKIMGDVADLSDEKHRLEHIILQLQNETDTICEYVALYQQQRSLLKKRDAERSEQIKIFQAECELLKKQLEELSNIIVNFTKDKELSSYFADKAKYSEVQKVMDLLSNLKSNSLIDPMRQSSELKNFYPCSCCSGQLIEV